MEETELTDPLGREIILNDRTWCAHILRGHPEMASHRRLVLDAIEKPNEIQFSKSHSDCRIYYGDGPRVGLQVAVVADVVEGIIKTAYLSRKTASGEKEW